MCMTGRLKLKYNLYYYVVRIIHMFHMTIYPAFHILTTHLLSLVNAVQRLFLDGMAVITQFSAMEW